MNNNTINTNLSSSGLVNSAPVNASDVIKVGDIIVSRSGYDACIARFAKVVAVAGKSVKIQRIRSIDSDVKNGGMDWVSVPAVNAHVGEVETKRVKLMGDTFAIKDNSYSTFFKWSGLPLECYNHH